MISRATKMVVVLTAVGLQMPTQAQKLPIACEQYFAAYATCTQSLVGYYERTDIPAANQLKDQQAQIEKMKADIRKLIASKGEDFVAERCTSPQFVKGMMDALSLEIATMRFANALDTKCVAKFNEIAH